MDCGKWTVGCGTVGNGLWKMDCGKWTMRCSSVGCRTVECGIVGCGTVGCGVVALSGATSKQTREMLSFSAGEASPSAAPRVVQ